MITKEQSELQNDILARISENLDISETLYEQITTSYQSVGEWLSKDNNPLAKYSPTIRPQGSFLLGTMIKPINEDDDVDIDMICELSKKPDCWTQKDLKNAIGNRIKMHDRYKKMLKSQEGGRRCWTLIYADSKYHMDIIPSLVQEGYTLIVDSAMSNVQKQDMSDLAIRITDRRLPNYDKETDPERWMSSNPIGYAKWFYSIAMKTSSVKLFSLNEAIRPVPSFQKKKYPLQVAVQLLKRHRDIHYGSDDDKPISIIITTLAARVYDKYMGDTVSATIRNIVDHINDFIIDDGIRYKVLNPVNPDENFADKWYETPRKKEVFFKWLKKLKKDMIYILDTPKIMDSSIKLKESFGDKVVAKIFTEISQEHRLLRENNGLKMTASGTLTTNAPISVKAAHTFHGKI